jgi:hypothetical protein
MKPFFLSFSSLLVYIVCKEKKTAIETSYPHAYKKKKRKKQGGTKNSVRQKAYFLNKQKNT